MVEFPSFCLIFFCFFFAVVTDPKVLIEGVLFRARYLGSTQLVRKNDALICLFGGIVALVSIWTTVSLKLSLLSQVCEGQPTKATRMMQAEEAVSRIKVIYVQMSSKGRFRDNIVLWLYPSYLTSYCTSLSGMFVNLLMLLTLLHINLSSLFFPSLSFSFCAMQALVSRIL